MQVTNSPLCVAAFLTSTAVNLGRVMDERWKIISKTTQETT